MKPQIVAMIIRNDGTATNTRECFHDAADLPVQYWGCEDVSLNAPEMETLVGDFEEAGETPVREVVTFDEEGGCSRRCARSRCSSGHSQHCDHGKPSTTHPDRQE
ncbi:hypothetical protein [Rhodococcus koreensis]